MKKNSLMRYIDSCVSNIARKIQDEFDENKHPRDEGGKFTSKGGEGGSETPRSENDKKSDVKIDPEIENNIRSTFEYDLANIEHDADSEEEYIENAIQHLEWTLEDTADTDERAMDNYGADAKTVAAVVNKMIEEFKGKKSEDDGTDEEESDPQAEEKAQLKKDMKGWWTRPEDVADDLKDAGYDEVEIMNDTNLYVSKGTNTYRVTLDKAGNTYTLRSIE